MKKVLLSCLAIVAVAVLAVITAYHFHQPTIVYLTGRLQAKMSRPGRTLGQSIYILNVPFHRQEHALSCEIASLKMALDAVGANVPESELIASLNFDSTPKHNGVWGNPYTGFVGSIDGGMLKTGYGVYWEPIAKVGQRYRRTQVLQNASIADLTNNLQHGRPIVVWGYFGGGGHTTWTTPDGQTINGIRGEHARTLIGFTGPAENPDSMILIDPIYGELNWSTSDFMRNWSALDNGAVAVYPYPRWAKAPGDNTVWEINADGITKQPMNMSWQEFIAQGGSPKDISEVQPEWLQLFSTNP